jgi:hypothetical protein
MDGNSLNYGNNTHLHHHHHHQDRDQLAGNVSKSPGNTRGLAVTIGFTHPHVTGIKIQEPAKFWGS